MSVFYNKDYNEVICDCCGERMKFEKHQHVSDILKTNHWICLIGNYVVTYCHTCAIALKFKKL